MSRKSSQPRTHNPQLSRRAVVRGGLALAASYTLGCRTSALLGRSSPITGAIVGASAQRGHRLLGGDFPPPTHTGAVDVVIVGGGVAGLSAAWQLERRGFTRFRLLELDSACGGNAASGANAVSPYPWGAHYIPVPTRESASVRELLSEFGVITSHTADGSPEYAEDYLCHEPEERLFRYGSWQRGLIPSAFTPPEERAEIERFIAHVHELRTQRGRDGRRPFEIPLELSSADPEYRNLDTISCTQYLDRNGYTSRSLRWYLTYCCRDDFGSGLSDTSAWALLHYFASRLGWAANAEPTDVLTWPEGNGWIVKRLTAKLAPYLVTNALVHSIDPHAPSVRYLDLARNESVHLTARKIIYAAPRFTAKRVIRAEHPSLHGAGMVYRPWMVANLTLSAPPDGPGTPLAWDNVIFDSESLGYVAATHQAKQVITGRTVLTYYLPLSGEPPEEARRRAAHTSWEMWRDQIINDLERAHPTIQSRIEQIDVWLWGHGMIAPTPGYIWGDHRREMCKPLDHLFFAHSDMSGISIFEEAHYRGVAAADAVLGQLGDTETHA